MVGDLFFWSFCCLRLWKRDKKVRLIAALLPCVAGRPMGDVQSGGGEEAGRHGGREGGRLRCFAGRSCRDFFCLYLFDLKS